MFWVALLPLDVCFCSVYFFFCSDFFRGRDQGLLVFLSVCCVIACSFRLASGGNLVWVHRFPGFIFNWHHNCYLPTSTQLLLIFLSHRSVSPLIPPYNPPLNPRLFCPKYNFMGPHRLLWGTSNMRSLRLIHINTVLHGGNSIHKRHT